LPSISLTAGGGTTSPDLGDLLSGWTFGLSQVVSIPIFDPAVQARLKVSEASTKVAEQEYRATVIRAFEEVENALVNLANHREQRREVLEQTEKLRVVARQVEAQLNEGMVSQLEVLESERSLLGAEQQLLLNQQLILSDTVELYKALGGGWPDDVVVPSDQATVQR
jgi:outer membrane protein TolC